MAPPSNGGSSPGSASPRRSSPPRARQLAPFTTSASSHSRSEQRAPKPPRLIARFALYTAAGLAFAGASILLFVRGYATSQAESSVKYHAAFLAKVALSDRLQPADFRAPVEGPRRAALDRLFRRWVLTEGVLRATLHSRDGTVTYSSDHSLIGKTTSESADVRKAVRGTVLRSRVSALDAGAEKGSDRKVIKEYVPVRFGRAAPAGVFVLAQDYAPISRAARDAFFPIAIVLELVLLALYVSLFPILRRVTDRLRHQLQEIEHQALHDSLTGLPNRALFRDRVEQALLAAKRTRRGVAVMLIDLDRFKEINDTLGHQNGDVLLQDLGARLRSVLRDSDTVARLGGDEFGIVLPKAAGARVAQTAHRVSAALDKPFELGGLSLRVGASIGVSLFPKDGDDVDSLLKHADVAMYVAKEAQSGYELYDAERDSNDASRLSLAGQLRDAIDEGELLLHFQPKAELRSGAIESVEALVRWQHPERGLLTAAEFVPLAGQTGLIRPLTAHVLEEALRHCRAWEEDGVELRVAVNLDMRDLLDLRFPEHVAELLGKWKLAPERLELEITEGTIMADPIRIRQVATRLSDMGVRLAIDDFGRGYSSLGYLKNLPIDELKIDKSFVMRMRKDKSDATIVRSTIELGRNLGLRVGAEGVETREDWEELKTLGCDVAQGFYLARPVSADEVVGLLQTWATRANVRDLPDASRGRPRQRSRRRDLATATRRKRATG